MTNELLGAFRESIFILVTLLFGAIVGVIFTYGVFAGRAISHQCAHYDPKSGAFTWNAQEQP